MPPFENIFHGIMVMMSASYSTLKFLFIISVIGYFVEKCFHSIKNRKLKNLWKRHVLVTGGSSGIGKCMAIEAAKLGADVTLIARNIHKLKEAAEEIKQYTVHKHQLIQPVSLDISQDYENVKKTLQELEKNTGPVYMLINCAGTAICGTLDDLSIEDAQHLVNLNFYGTLFTIKALIAEMKERRDGYIVITSSQAALMGIYGLSVYSSTKFALRGLAEALYMELEPYNINVTLALPPDTDTPGFENEEKTKPEATRLISKSGGLYKPEVVAKKLMRDALEKKTFFSTVGFQSYLFTILCSGMSPNFSPGETVIQSVVMALMRFLGAIVYHSFRKIVQNCERKKGLIR